MKKILFVIIASILFSSCATKFAITSGEESLSALTKITNGEEPCQNPFGGNEGKNLFYAARENKYYYNICKKDNAFSTAVSSKTSGKNMNMAPAYCAKTDQIAFRCQNEGASSSDICIMSASKGKAIKQVTDSPDAFENNPSFSTDGKLIAYDKQTYTVKNTFSFFSLFGANSSVLFEKSEIWIKNLETGESILIGNGYQPCISPDCSKIVYVKYSQDIKNSCLWIMDIDGENQVQLTDAKRGYASYPKWSPDGKRIIFQSTLKDKKDSDLYVINIDGDELTQLTKNKSNDCQPYWSNDGYIYFVSDRGSKQNDNQIWRFKIEE